MIEDLQGEERKFGELMLRLKAQSEENKIEEKTCPYCHSEMIKRKSKFNDGFWFGCSNFPRCRYTEKII
jgi:ssDNA-binding Zn-finger/Zn-ribbon topoisomerase 1